MSVGGIGNMGLGQMNAPGLMNNPNKPAIIDIRL